MATKVIRSGNLNILHEESDYNDSDNDNINDNLLLIMSRLCEFETNYDQTVKLLNEYFSDTSSYGTLNKDKCDFRFENYNTVFVHLNERNPILSFGFSFNMEEYKRNILQHVVKREWHITFEKECVHCGIIINRLQNIGDFHKHAIYSKIFENDLLDHSRIYFELQIHFKTIRNKTIEPDFQWLEKGDKNLAQDLLSLFSKCNINDNKVNGIIPSSIDQMPGVTIHNNSKRQKRKINDYFDNTNNDKQIIRTEPTETTTPTPTLQTQNLESSFFFDQNLKKRKLDIDYTKESTISKKFIDLYNYCLNEKYNQHTNDILVNDIVRLMSLYINNQMISIIMNIIEKNVHVDNNHIQLYMSEIYKKKFNESPIVKSDVMNNFRQAWSIFLHYCASNNNNRHVENITIYNKSLSLLIKYCSITNMKQSNSFINANQEICWEKIDSSRTNIINKDIYCIISGSKIDPTINNFYKIKIGTEGSNDIYIYAKNESAKNLCNKILLIINTFTINLNHYLYSYTHHAYSSFISNNQNIGNNAQSGEPNYINNDMHKNITFIKTYYLPDQFIDYQKKNNITYTILESPFSKNNNDNNTKSITQNTIPNINYAIHTSINMIISNISCLCKYKKVSCKN